MINSVLLLFIIALGLYIASHQLTGIQIVVALSLIVGGVVLVISPDLASYAAKALNVGRGSDLIIYLSMIGGLFVSANFYFRFKRSERQMIEVVRALALIQATRESDR